ncbi:hypothetical protein SAY87_031584 [Trapa incisa]|uniref:Uncharacterized protein n=1 Tax=Trapa incisa TaxID=236973 RepID=A0AAN7KXZ4_9MYRT|nr:hypothetical protein SAY87_031584 [Trapa incisa]
MISGNDVYEVISALVPLYVAMFLAYGSVRWWGVFTAEQCSGINLFVDTFAVPFMGFKLIAVPGSTREIVSIKVDSDVVEP